MPANLLGFGNKVKRSESVKSERSDASQKRVSFNRDVHVKNIPRGTVVDRNGRVVVVLRDHEDLRDWPRVYKEPPRLQPEEAEAEADHIIRQIDNLICTTSTSPVFYDTLPLDRGKLPVDRGKLQPRNNQNNSTLERKTRSKTLPSSVTKNKLERHLKINNAEKNRLEENSKLNPICEKYDSSLEGSGRRLDPIVESSQTKSVQRTYLDVNHLNKVNHSKTFNSSENMALPKRPATSHSSQLPADKPRLTRTAVNSIVQQFNEEALQRELLKKQKEREGVEESFPSLVSPILVEPGQENSHNNNRPFSYTDVSPGYVPLRKTTPKRVPAPVLPATPDYTLKSPSEVIYAQVVVNSKNTAGSNKQTVHTSVPSKKVDASDVGGDRDDFRSVKRNNVLQDVGKKEDRRETSAVSSYEDVHNFSSSKTHITNGEGYSRRISAEGVSPSYSPLQGSKEHPAEDEERTPVTRTSNRTTPDRNSSHVTSRTATADKYNKYVTNIRNSLEKNIQDRSSRHTHKSNSNIVRVNVNGYKGDPVQRNLQRGGERSSSPSPERRDGSPGYPRHGSPGYTSHSTSPELYSESRDSNNPSPDRYYFGTNFDSETYVDSWRVKTVTNGRSSEVLTPSPPTVTNGRPSGALTPSPPTKHSSGLQQQQKEHTFSYCHEKTTNGMSLLSSTRLVKEVEKSMKSELSPVNLLNGNAKAGVVKNMSPMHTEQKVSKKDDINLKNEKIYKVATKENQEQKEKSEMKKQKKKKEKSEKEKGKKRKIKIIFKQKEEDESENERLKRFTEYRGSDYDNYGTADFRSGYVSPQEYQADPPQDKSPRHAPEAPRSATLEKQKKKKSRGSEVDNKLVNINIEIEDEDPDKVEKIRRQREQFFSAFLDEAHDKMETSENEEYRGISREKTKEHQMQWLSSGEADHPLVPAILSSPQAILSETSGITLIYENSWGGYQEQTSLGEFEKSWCRQDDMETDYRRDLATARHQPEHMGTLASDAVDASWPSQTLNRLEMKNKRNKQEDVTRARTLDRAQGNRKKEKVTQKKKDNVQEESVNRRSEKSSGVARKPSFNVRYFGDTDLESQYSGPSMTSSHKRKIEPSKTKIRRSSSSVAGVRRGLFPRGAHEAAQHDRVPPVSVSSSLNSSESENGSHASQVSNGSNRSVYLHATTVADIPPSDEQRRRSRSRDELSTIEESGKPYSKKVSRSFSLLSPWKPRHNRERYEVHYDSGSQAAAKPPKYPRKKEEGGASRISASAESLREVQEGEDAVSPLPSFEDEKKEKKKKKVTVSRSVSMPKDSRLAGWFRKKKAPGDAGSNNL